jgi:Ca2+-binding EF-hand superfamily protein
MRILSLVAATSVFALGSGALAQTAARPVTRSDFVNSLNNRFSAMDTNHDGSLSSEELTTEQQKEMQQAKNALSQQLATKFKQLDTNKDGQLSLQEFQAAAPQLRATTSPGQLLQTLDSNKDGKVSAEEYRAPQVAKFNQADTNKDGTVTPAEAQAAAGKK